MSNRARLQVALVTLTLLLLAGLASATPCTGPTLGAVMAEGTCTIGDKTFNFSNSYYGSVYDSATQTQTYIDPNTITFQAIISNTAPGFTLGGFPVVTGTPNNYQYAYLYDYFTVAAPNGRMITTAPVTENGALFTGGAAQYAYSYGCSVNCFSYDTYVNVYGNVSEGTSNPAFNLQTLAGYLYLYNYSQDAGTSSFDSMTFTFNQSPTNTPEPASLALLGSGLLLAGGLVRRKLNAKS